MIFEGDLAKKVKEIKVTLAEKIIQKRMYNLDPVSFELQIISGADNQMG